MQEILSTEGSSEPSARPGDLICFSFSFIPFWQIIHFPHYFYNIIFDIFDSHVFDA